MGPPNPAVNACGALQVSPLLRMPDPQPTPLTSGMAPSALAGNGTPSLADYNASYQSDRLAGDAGDLAACLPPPAVVPLPAVLTATLSGGLPSSTFATGLRVELGSVCVHAAIAPMPAAGPLAPPPLLAVSRERSLPVVAAVSGLPSTMAMLATSPSLVAATVASPSAAVMLPLDGASVSMEADPFLQGVDYSSAVPHPSMVPAGSPPPGSVLPSSASVNIASAALAPTVDLGCTVPIVPCSGSLQAADRWPPVHPVSVVGDTAPSHCPPQCPAATKTVPLPLASSSRLQVAGRAAAASMVRSEEHTF